MQEEFCRTKHVLFAPDLSRKLWTSHLTQGESPEKVFPRFFKGKQTQVDFANLLSNLIFASLTLWCRS